MARRRWLVTLGLLNVADIGLSLWGGAGVEANPVVRYLLELGNQGLIPFVGLKLLGMGVALWAWNQWDNPYFRVGVVAASTGPMVFVVIWNIAQGVK